MAGLSVMVAMLTALLGVCFALKPWDLVPPLQLDAPLNYDFHGSTVVGRNYVKLTGNEPDQSGYIVSNFPGPLPENFEILMEVQVGGGGRNLYGDGMVLWLLENDPKQGNMFGLDEYYKGAALAIDTYRNGPSGRVFPRMVIMTNDGTQSYDKDHDGNKNEIGGCSMRGLHDNRRQDYSSVRVSYSKRERLMTVDVNFRSGWELCDCPTVELGALSRIAVSAATGELVERHVVKSLQVKDLGDELPDAIQKRLTDLKEKERRGAERAQKKKLARRKPSKFKKFVRAVSKLLWLFVKLAVLAFGCFKAYQYFLKYKQKREDAKYKLT